MSYINDALKKAQRERDGRYGRFGGIIAAGAERPAPPRKRTRVIGAAVAILVVVPAGLLLFFYVMQQPLTATKETSRPDAAENAAASRPPSPRATGEKAPETVPGAALPAGSKVEVSAAPGGGAPVPKSGNPAGPRGHAVHAGW